MRWLLLICIWAVVPPTGHGQSIEDLIDRDQAFDQASVGLSVRELKSGTEAISYHSEKLLAPASSLKVITTLIAINHLGEDYRYQTPISYSGKLDSDGTLHGDIIITGSGDPTLGSSRWGEETSYTNMIARVVQAVQAAGITCIDGAVVADPTIFAGQAVPDQWNYNDIGNYYGSGACGININENLYHLYFHSNTPQGQKAKLSHTTPAIKDMQLVGEVVVAGPNTGDQAYIYGTPDQELRIVRGTIPQSKSSFSIKGSMPSPPLQAAQLIADALEKAGVQVSEGYAVRKATPSEELITITSPTLTEIVEEANHHSINLYCDALLRTLSAEAGGSGSINAGIATIIDHLAAMGLPSKEILLKDGSGLAGENKVTARLMTLYLQNMQTKMGRKVLQYLPKAGKEGTVKRLLRGSEAAPYYFLKSGSFEGVQSYTGYVKAKSGKSYSICFMVNNYQVTYGAMRKKMEKILTTIYKQY